MSLHFLPVWLTRVRKLPSNPGSDSSEIGRARTSRRPLSTRRRILFTTIYLVYIIGLVGLGSKLFWKLRFDVPLTGTPQDVDVLQYYYPELRTSGVSEARITRDDGYYDVLMLGASVLEQVSDLFEEELRNRLGNRLRVYKLSRSTRTSRDSFLKYAKLSNQEFDLIVVYHGINDARMNYCPPAQFKDDYTHCHWYKSLQLRVAAKSLTIPALVHDQLHGLFSRGDPEEKYIDYGRTIKTAGPFRRNLEEIVEAAQAKNQHVLLMTFAYYIPKNYSKKKFDRHELGYGQSIFGLPAEVWGKPEYVAATLDAHNAMVRDLAGRYDNLIFVDQQQLLPQDGEHFGDPCHLTEAGCRAFVQNMLRAIDEQLPMRH